ncbi:MAG: right-handed parallel beta-helix repeat-containing protein [Bacteroidia bacterium]
MNKYLTLLIFVLASRASNTYARSIIVEVNDGLIDGNTMGVLPGDTLLIETGQWEYLTFRNMHGTRQNPIVATNYGGKVQVHSNNSVYYKQGINIKESHFFKLMGNGDESVQYGFEISLTYIGSGLDLRENVHHVEASFVEIHNTHFAGVMVKEDPRCDGRFLRGAYLMTGIVLNNNYIHDTNGEGIYAGITAYNGFRKSCYGQPDTLYGVMLDSLTISQNVLKRTGREGIQVFSTYYALVSNNAIDSFGTSANPIHSNGISLGLGSGGEMVNNTITNGYGHGINHAAKWKWNIANNLIVNSGMLNVIGAQNILACGIYFDERFLDENVHSVVVNNTIINSKHNALRVVNDAIITSHDVTIANNIICSYGLGAAMFSKSDNDPFNFRYPFDIELHSNYHTGDTCDIKFKDAANGKYELSKKSALLNQGMPNLNTHSLDLNGNPRIVGRTLDLGAYEQQVIVSNESLGLNTCTKTIYKNKPVLDGTVISHSAGDTICLMGGNWRGITIRNFVGSNDSPVVFRNAISTVKVDSQYFGIDIKFNENIELHHCLSGSIGWQISNTQGNGLVLVGNNGVRVNGVEILNSKNSGIILQENANITSSLNSDLVIENVQVTQNNGKACVHLNRYGANKAQHFNFESSISFSGSSFQSNAAPVFMLNHNDLNLALFNNVINTSNAIVFDANKTFKANISRNRIELNDATLFDLEGRNRLRFHNNIVSGHAGNKYLLVSRKGSNGYKQRDIGLALVSNTFNLGSCSGLWFGNNAIWNSSNVEIINNAIATDNLSSFKLSNYTSTQFTAASNAIFDSIDVDNEFVDVASNNYYPTTIGSLYANAAAMANDSFSIDFNGEDRAAYYSIDIGALVSLPTQNGSGNSGAEQINLSSNHSTPGAPQVSIYPNPATEKVKIDTDLPFVATVYTLNQRKIEVDADDRGFIDVKDLPEGINMLVIDIDGQSLSTSLIIQK